MTHLRIVISRRTVRFLLLFYFALLAQAGCIETENSLSESGDKETDYRTVVNVLNDCDGKFYSSFVLVKDRASADYMLKCLSDTTNQLSETIAKFKSLPPLEAPENLKYVQLITDEELDYKSMLQSPPPPAIAAEMVEAVEVYMAKHLEFVMKFGLVIKPEQLTEENKLRFQNK